MLDFVRSTPSVPPSRPAPRVTAVLALWYRRWSSRRQLARMDERMLRDIGLSPIARRREAHRRFWQP